MRVIALVVGGCLAAWLAEATGEGGSQPTFRSGVELVTIDVVATDRSGKPVHDLKASDFELFEDGKSQPIKTFQFVDASLVPTEAILPPGIVTNDVEPGGIFALVLDEIGYYVTEVQDVRRAGIGRSLSTTRSRTSKLPLPSDPGDAVSKSPAPTASGAPALSRRMPRSRRPLAELIDSSASWRSDVSVKPESTPDRTTAM